ncbi:hypothetical protein CSIM01_13211 [Colletotrichum simmondsii]|uniref:F-box domain-containing protein n=1 Tax=Colletotrichum simmondsii TaxID=703756 RepID=A0A135TG68_9PEZI|nr:hypothetical protein CSIM01_13211 [Colletotrichum simmondsii]
MKTDSPTTARLRHRKDLPSWLVQLKFQAHQHNIWEYIDPTAPPNASDPTQRILYIPKINELISWRRIQLKEQYFRELQAAYSARARGSPQQPLPPAPAVVTHDDIREEFKARLAEYYEAVVKRDDIIKEYRAVWNWVHATVDTSVLCAARATAAAEDDCSLRVVVRALRDRFGPARDREGSLVWRLFLGRLLVRRTLKRVKAVAKDSVYRIQPKAYLVSSLLKLPNEMLFHIISFLELHDQFILRQTCKDMQVLLQKDWRLLFTRLAVSQKLDFLAGLAFTSPNHWVCGGCHQLHRIDTNDIPWHKLGTCPHDKDRARFLSRFGIRESHVQLALKLTRLKTAADQEYLKKIMSPFTPESGPYSDQKNKSSFHAAPRIIADKFLLYMQHERIYQKDQGIWQVSASICRHIGGCESRIGPPKELGNAVRLAVNQPGIEVNGHCSRCPTDYSVILGPEPDRLTIRAWHDYGSYKSPNDKSWTAPVYGTGNTYSPGPKVYRDPGSIRMLYASGTTLGNVR